jgi:hypothetical protein
METRREYDIQLGQLIEAVSHLTSELKAIRGELNDLHKELDDIRERMNTGKGIIIGLLFSAGASGAGIYHMIKGWLQ